LIDSAHPTSKLVMPLNLRTLSIVALACTLAACSDSTAPTTPQATVTVPVQSIAATTVTSGGMTMIQFSIPVQIENKGTVPLAFVYCASQVQARDADAWAGAWSPICATVQTVPEEIAPGQRRDLTVAVGAVVAGPGGPAWHAGPTATEFRFVAGLVLPGTSGTIPQLASNTFMLTVAN
jgi:hypothetical protein